MKLKQMFGVTDERAGKQGATLREPSAGEIDRIYRVVLGQALDDEAPGKRVAHESVHDQQRRPAAGMKIAPTDAIDEGRTVFDAGNPRNLGYSRAVQWIRS